MTKQMDVAGVAAQYEKLVAIAEEAVELVKNPELKMIAFQRVLEDVLERRKTGR